MNMYLKEIDSGVFVVPSEVVSVESNGYWKCNGPSDDSGWEQNGTRLILKNGRKVYTKLSVTEVMEKLKTPTPDSEEV